MATPPGVGMLSTYDFESKSQDSNGLLTSVRIPSSPMAPDPEVLGWLDKICLLV